MVSAVVGAIIWYVTTFACAALMFGIGAYANRLEKPMWFWSGTEVDPKTITDVKAYNRENSRMWKWYSAWFWAAGLLWIWNAVAAVAVLVLGCTLGAGLLMGRYLRIEKKYKKTGL